MRPLIIVLFCIYAFGASYYIDFAGNRHFDRERLYHELGFSQSLWQKILRKPFKPKVDEKLLPSLQDELTLFYQEQGFLDARVEVYIQKDLALFKIHEGTPVTIAALSVTSNFPLQIPFKKGERFIASDFIAFKKQTQKRLLQAGYCSYEFNPKVYIYQKSHLAYIAIYLDKGSVCTVGEISVHGLRTLPKRVILSHLYLKKGEEFNLTKLQESYKRLYSLEYFDTLRFDYTKKIKNRIFLDIFAKERQKRHIYRVGLGYETDRGAIASLSYRNLNLDTHQLSLLLRYSQYDRKAAIKLFTPSVPLFGTFADMRDEAGYSYDEFESFTSRSLYLKHALLFEHFDHSYKIGIAAQRYTITSHTSCINGGRYDLLYPYGEVLLDRRDDKLFPREGFYILARAEAALPFISEADYLKIRGEGALFYPLGHNVVLFKVRAGFITTSSGLPPSKLFVGGGLGTNRAYAYRTIYALDSDCKIGGKSLLATTLEYRFPFKNLYGAIFWDRTSIARNYKLSSFVDGVGIGGLYRTPIGTVRIYFGVDPDDISQNQLTLSVGASF